MLDQVNHIQLLRLRAQLWMRFATRLNCHSPRLFIPVAAFTAIGEMIRLLTHEAGRINPADLQPLLRGWDCALTKHELRTSHLSYGLPPPTIIKSLDFRDLLTALNYWKGNSSFRMMLHAVKCHRLHKARPSTP